MRLSFPTPANGNRVESNVEECLEEKREPCGTLFRPPGSLPKGPQGWPSASRGRRAQPRNYQKETAAAHKALLLSPQELTRYLAEGIAAVLGVSELCFCQGRGGARARRLFLPTAQASWWYNQACRIYLLPYHHVLSAALELRTERNVPLRETCGRSRA